jgi:hypothetical protein
MICLGSVVVGSSQINLVIKLGMNPFYWLQLWCMAKSSMLLRFANRVLIGFQTLVAICIAMVVPTFVVVLVFSGMKALVSDPIGGMIATVQVIGFLLFLFSALLAPFAIWGGAEWVENKFGSKCARIVRCVAVCAGVASFVWVRSLVEEADVDPEQYLRRP